MKELKLNKKNKVKVLQEALEVLNNGGVIVYPTETSYGLGANFFDAKAVKKIYRIKDRSKDKYLPVIVPDYVSAVSLVKFTFLASNLAQQKWPGPLTLILPFRHGSWQKHLPENLALRVSSHPFVQDLVKQFASPLVSTSANISNQPDSYSAKSIFNSFVNAKVRPDLFINAGNLPKNNPSTIISFIDDEVKIIRQGSIKINLNKI